MNEAALVIVGVLGGGGIPAFYLLRAQRRQADASADTEEANTDSVIVTTTDRLVGIVDREIQRYEGRVVAVEAENEALRSEHRKCQDDLYSMHVELNTEKRHRKDDERRIDALMVEQENARDQRLRQQEQTEVLLARVATLQAQLDGPGFPTAGSSPA